MNSDQVKKALGALRRTEADYTVVLSGKKSRKVNGLYKPESREIIVHNRNFTNDNEMMHTAIHEFAHHIQFTTSPTPISVRSHTAAFWNLFHTLLFDAERKGLYRNPFDSIPELRALAERIKEKFLAANGSMMKELGRLLVEAHALCDAHGASFSDFVDRVLAIPRASAQTIMKAHTLDLDPRVGFENMRVLAGIRDDKARGKAQEALMGGFSPDMVKARFAANRKEESPLRELESERERIVRTIERLQAKLAEIEKRIDGLEEE